MMEKRTIGLNFTSENTANLVVWAPMAKSLKVLIIHKAMKEMVPQEFGYWHIRDLEIKPGDDYHIIMDGTILPDPASLYQPNDVHGPSQAFNTGKYQWTDSQWKGIPQAELIIYELHTGTFTPEGTFDGIIQKLDYLSDLGINAIELMPVSQFPGTRNWGYDGVYPFAVQHTYGGPAELQRLVDACHQKGLALILDVVYNHLGPDGNYLPAFGPVFTDKYKTPWGQAINFDDAWSDGIREFYIQNALMWFRDFHIDGLRLDAVHAIKDFGTLHILREIRERVMALNEKVGRNHFLICESDLNDIKYIAPFQHGGYDLDATWCDEFHHALHSLVTGEKKGYYSDFSSIRHLVKAINDAFVYDGTWSENRKRKFGNKTTGIPGHKFVVFAQNHDQVGNRMNGDRLSTLINFELLKVVAGTLLATPFIPLLFMGEEYAEENPFLYFTSHSDEHLIRMIREGRKREFKAFMTEEGEPPDPQSGETFLNSRLNWKMRNNRQTRMHAFYKELIKLRKTIPALKNTDRSNLSALAVADSDALYITRKYQDKTLVTFINFENSVINISLNTPRLSQWKLLMNSSDKKWGGPGSNPEIENAHSFSIPAQSFIVMGNTDE